MRSPHWLALTVCLIAVPAAARDYKLGSLQVEQPWSRATPPSAAVAAGYLGIRNEGAADRLVSGSTPLADRLEIHEMTMADNVMKMRPLPSGVELPAAGSVRLEPGGLHLMMIGLKRPLKQGERVPVTLVFEKAGRLDIELEVAGLGAAKPMAGH